MFMPRVYIRYIVFVLIPEQQRNAIALANKWEKSERSSSGQKRKYFYSVSHACIKYLSHHITSPYRHLPRAAAASLQEAGRGIQDQDQFHFCFGVSKCWKSHTNIMLALPFTPVHDRYRLLRMPTNTKRGKVQVATITAVTTRRERM